MKSLLKAAPIRSGIPAEGRAVHVLGLTFRNCLGIAAGIDRSGRLLPSLPGLAAGHVELGTVTDPRGLHIVRTPGPIVPLVGVNIGSAKPGDSDEVLAEYRACLLAALPLADYVVLNFSNEAARRTLSSQAGHRVVSMARTEMLARARRGGQHIPLLAKLPAGSRGEGIPVAAVVADELDGFVLAGECPARLTEFRKAFPHHGIVSAGGVMSARDVLTRTLAGCDLVQVHRAFAEGGVKGVEHILQGLESIE